MMNAEQLVGELAESAIREVAPEQLELFALLGKAYLADPGGAPHRRSERDEALGIGVGAAEAFLVAIAVLAANTAVHQLVTRGVEGGIDQAKGWFKRWRRDRTPRAQGPLPAGALPIDGATAERIREAARDKAVQAGMAEPTALLLADAIVGALQRHKE